MKSNYVVVRVSSSSYESRNNLVGGKNLQAVGSTYSGIVLYGCHIYDAGERVEILRNQSYEVREGVYVCKPEFVVYCGDLDELIK